MTCLCQAVAASNGMNLIGYGTRSLGMGGVGEAIVNNTESMMINPAGLAADSRPELSAALSLIRPDVSQLSPAPAGHGSRHPPPLTAVILHIALTPALR